MNPKYVPSLELCKQLKENGWKKETLFWWIIETENLGHWCNDVFTKDRVSAPLSDEILEELPVSINNNKFMHDLSIRKDDEGYYNINYGSMILITEKGLPNALSKYLLYLINNGIISLKGD